jgi:hypothetical protein
MTVIYSKIFYFKLLKNLPNLDFWFENIASGNPVPRSRNRPQPIFFFSAIQLQKFETEKLKNFWQDLAGP